MASTIASARRSRSGWPCGRIPRWAILALTKSIAAPFGHDATQAPQPMHSAKSIASSAVSLAIGIALASGADRSAPR